MNEPHNDSRSEIVSNFFWDFDKREESQRTKKVCEAYVNSVDFTTMEWIDVHKECAWSPRCHNLKIAALKKAVEKASTLFDWVKIAENTQHENRKLAFEKILTFDIRNDEDVRLLCKSSCERLANVGWYLAGRRRIVSKASNNV